jgi:hypothetical protein
MLNYSLIIVATIVLGVMVVVIPISLIIIGSLFCICSLKKWNKQKMKVATE